MPYSHKSVSITKDLHSLVPGWREKKLKVQRVFGGITNENFQVSYGTKKYFVKFLGKRIGLLGINLSNLYQNSAIGSILKISPQVLYFFPKSRIIIHEWCEGEVLTKEAIAEDANSIVPEVCKIMDTLHKGPKFRNYFDIFLTAMEYRENLLNLNKKEELPDYLNDLYQELLAIYKKMKHLTKKLCPGHNDPLAENFIRQEGKIYLLDYDYSGQSDPYFDIASFCLECNLPLAVAESMCQQIFGTWNKEDEARIIFYQFAADVMWALWSDIQALISIVDFDYRGYKRMRVASAEDIRGTSEFQRALKTLS